MRPRDSPFAKRAGCLRVEALPAVRSRLLLNAQLGVGQSGASAQSLAVAQAQFGTRLISVRSLAGNHRREIPAQMPVTLRDLRALWPLAFFAIVAVLYFARAVFIPLAVPVLLTFILAPPARLLRRLGLPHVPASLTVV